MTAGAAWWTAISSPDPPRGEGPVESRRHDPRDESNEPLRGTRGGAENSEDPVRAPPRHHRDRRRGTLAAADRLSKDGINVIGVPGLIDNDLRAMTTRSDSAAVNIASGDGPSHTTRCPSAAWSPRVMGRHVGWIALHAGIARARTRSSSPGCPSRSTTSAGSSRRRTTVVVPGALVVFAEVNAKRQRT